MTVGVAYRVPGHGAVLCCDGRICDPDTGAVHTERAEKWMVGGSVVAMYAGEIGWAWLGLRDNPPKTWRELCERLEELRDRELDYSILAYDRTKDRLVHTDSADGAALPGLYGAVGCGGSVALGALDASPAPTSLTAAAKLVARAVRIACRRNAMCGGRVRTLVIPGRRGAVTVS